MYEKSKKPTFISTLAPLIDQFIAEKNACGYSYSSRFYTLMAIDRFLHREECPPGILPRDLIERWLEKRPHESSRTLSGRYSTIRQFAIFLMRIGIPAHVPALHSGQIIRSEFSARIFTPTEIRSILNAVDNLLPDGRAPIRHLIMPEIYRLLYGCGLRVGEVVRLRVKDVDLDNGVLTITNSKFGKDRLVPPSASVVERLRRYALLLGNSKPDGFFFPAPNGGCYSVGSIYSNFRLILVKAGISHEGRGRGPRLHDMRHTFATHRLFQWHRDRADLNSKIPILATFLGHRDISGTQKYLQLTPDLFPDITEEFEKSFGHVFPRRCENEND